MQVFALLRSRIRRDARIRDMNPKYISDLPQRYHVEVERMALPKGVLIKFNFVLEPIAIIFSSLSASRKIWNPPSI